jgi:hypothetical protein
MYFPKSQITPNLYTNGGEFVIIQSNKPYTGYYFKVSNGKTYTGRTPDDKPNIELIPTILENMELNNNIIITPTPFSFITSYEENTNSYLKVNTSNINNIKIPYYSPTLPTSQDYQNGEFQRYFCKKTNEIKYIEINKEQFDKLVSQDPQIEFSLYQPFTITWIISGNKDTVAKTNRNIVELASFKQKLPRLADYLRFDYTKYLK